MGNIRVILTKTVKKYLTVNTFPKLIISQKKKI